MKANFKGDVGFPFEKFQLAAQLINLVSLLFFRQRSKYWKRNARRATSVNKKQSDNDSRVNLPIDVRNSQDSVTRKK